MSKPYSEKLEAEIERLAGELGNTQEKLYEAAEDLGVNKVLYTDLRTTCDEALRLLAAVKKIADEKGDAGFVWIDTTFTTGYEEAFEKWLAEVDAFLTRVESPA